MTPMKTIPVFPRLAALAILLAPAAFLAPAPCFATAVGTSLVYQPVNLGTRSEPDRIPMGAIATIANHGYGIHHVVTRAKPCPDGPMLWKNGSELDQNLASVFGISLEIPDDTQILAAPVTFRLKPWKPPGYSPYTKEQVLAATLHCLLATTSPDVKIPLVARVVTEAPEDKPLEAKFSGSYHLRDDDDKPVDPKIPGTRVETDARNIPWVVFPDVKARLAGPRSTPALIITTCGGEGDPGWRLLPVWGNRTDDLIPYTLNLASVPFGFIWQSYQGAHESNGMLGEGGAGYLGFTHGENGDTVSMTFPRVPQATLAANVLALVIAAQPTEARPLTVKIILDQDQLGKYPAFSAAAGWKETRPSPTLLELESTFVWDPAKRWPSKGSIPLISMNKNWFIEETNPAGEEAAR